MLNGKYFELAHKERTNRMSSSFCAQFLQTVACARLRVAALPSCTSGRRITTRDNVHCSIYKTLGSPMVLFSEVDGTPPASLHLRRLETDAPN